MQAYYESFFEREYGCTEAEWLGWLPDAIGACPWSRPAPGRAEVVVGGGALHLAWAALPPRRIALVTMPRLAVTFHFEGADEAVRQGFMKRFDLYMQRGGG